MSLARYLLSFVFFTDSPTTEFYTLSLHDALPISGRRKRQDDALARARALVQQQRQSHPPRRRRPDRSRPHAPCGQVGVDEERSEEHTSELQSHSDLVCRLLLEKKKEKTTTTEHTT